MSSSFSYTKDTVLLSRIQWIIYFSEWNLFSIIKPCPYRIFKSRKCKDPFLDGTHNSKALITSTKKGTEYKTQMETTWVPFVHLRGNGFSGTLKSWRRKQGHLGTNCLSFPGWEWSLADAKFDSRTRRAQYLYTVP